MRKPALFIAALLASLPFECANALTGTQLYELCAGNSGSTGNTACLAYARGFSEGFLLGTAFTPNIYCAPDDGVSAEQARLIIQKYLRDHPEELHKEALYLAGNAMMAAFRCKKNK